VLRDLVVKNRSYRRWRQDPIPRETLAEWIDLARITPSGANQQALKYIISDSAEKNALIYRRVGIDNNPPEGERAPAYIVILEDQNIKMLTSADLGIAAQTIMLAATEAGYGGVMIGMIDRPALKQDLGLPDHLQIALILAIGKTMEKVIIDPQEPGTITRQHWEDETLNVRHVPKRSLEEIIVDYPE